VEDASKMRIEVNSMTDAFVAEQNVEEKYIHEILRFSLSKLHCISAFLGGVASQESCKLIMGQYMPINHTLIYDGIHGRGGVFNI
jgi:hypothetical protein